LEGEKRGAFPTLLWRVGGVEDFVPLLHGTSTPGGESEVVALSGRYSGFKLFFHRSTLSTTTGVYLLRKKA
jgi:hypothetical protein